FTRELANVTRLYELSADTPTVRIPRPYPALSTARVLTAELLDGVPLSEVLLAVRSGRAAEIERIDAHGIDRERVATHLLQAILEQIFTDRFFHADLHPGNLLILPDDVIGFVDFGLCARIDDAVWEQHVRYLGAGYNG